MAEVAKYEVTSISTWLGIETAYFLIQFMLFGLALGLIYRERADDVLS